MNTSRLGRGINQETEQEEEVTIGDIERRGGLLLRGNPRTGKTTLLVNLILQDIAHGHGLMFIDPHGDAIDDILKRLPCREEDVILFDPFDKDYAFSLNLFECDPTNRREVTRTVNYVLHMFAKLFTEKGDLAREAPTMDETMQHTAELLIDNQGYLIDGKSLGMTMSEIPWIFNYEEARQRLTPQLTNDHDQATEFWQGYERDKQDQKKETVASTKRRISKFLSDPHIKHIVGQKTSTIDFRDIIDNKKILLVKLTRDDDLLTNFIGSILIGKLLNTIYADPKPEDKRIDFALYCDEFQNFATPEFAKLFTETGKWHIMPTVSHQVGSLLEDTIRGAIATAAIKVLYQLTEDDAKEFAPEFAKTPQAAWEEEIEKEWHERVEEVVEDGVEEIKIVHTDPLGWFRQGHGHSNSRVIELVEKCVSPLIEAEHYKNAMSNPRERQNNMNSLLYRAMKGELLAGNVPTAQEQKKRLFTEFTLYLNCARIIPDKHNAKHDAIAVNQLPPENDYYVALNGINLHPTWEGVKKTFEVFFNSYQGNGHFPTEKLESLRKTIYSYRLIWVFALSFPETKEDTPQGFNEARAMYRSVSQNWWSRIEENRSALSRHGYQPLLHHDAVWRVPEADQKRLSEITHLFCEMIETAYTKWLQEIDTNPRLSHRKKEAERLAQQDIQQIITFITDWDELAKLLAAEPIQEGSGLSQPRKRTQVHYLTHPRKTIMHPQRTEQDMRGEMEREFVNLPRYTAYCRLVKEISGKQVVGKYELYPYPLSAEDSQAVWQARLHRIIERTQLTYCKPRSEVVAEIKARKEELTKPLKKQAKARTGTGDGGKVPHLTPAQLDKLNKIKAALGDKDYDRFYNDPEVQHTDNLKRLLDKDVATTDIKIALNKWRAAGSPANISPFAELIKTLLA